MGSFLEKHHLSRSPILKAALLPPNSLKASLKRIQLFPNNIITHYSKVQYSMNLTKSGTQQINKMKLLKIENVESETCNIQHPFKK